MLIAIPSAPADRFALIIEGLCQAVGRRGDPRRFGFDLAGLSSQLLLLIWVRLRRMKTRFAARAARHATTPPASSPARPARLPGDRLRQPDPLPRGRAWLLCLIPETAAGASQLRYFLADPEVASLLAEAPQLRRILRPLCHMLGLRAAQIPSLQDPPQQDPLKQDPIKQEPPPSTLPSPCHAAPQAAPAASPPAAIPPPTPDAIKTAPA